ncbi:transcriptional regulator, LuxR family [Stackebrandtia nassauensis DSM 44728]|uniref:Transcriptional regulator, LuxR family n=1 Tax=Stackebrandtia nassauensis (strain DSM 44728 / CIP 108903 / NRRL B-16338 / NBRC 102104 / LLR-40K-21) TaxID=446470 RepID=D3Q363_STANL|nr:transcriptional regulator, LuxR family [Stackebrandtia nassauensis DSM 44728]
MPSSGADRVFDFDLLNADATTVYTTVVGAQPISREHLARLTGMPAERLRDAVERLTALGLVSQGVGEEERLIAAPPDIALEALLLGEEERLKRARLWARSLSAEYYRRVDAADPSHLVEVVVGREAVFERFQQIQQASRHQIRVIDKPPYAAPDAELNIPNERELLRRGVVWRVIYDAAGLESFHRLEGDVRNTMTAGESARVLSDAPIKLMISDDRLGMLPLQIAPRTINSIVVVHRSALLEALSALFEQLWCQALPLVHSGEPQGPTTEPTEIERQLLMLLTAGLTDERIAERMGVSLRTMQRRLRELLERLGATTRFQAGIRATLQGWIRVPEE